MWSFDALNDPGRKNLVDCLAAWQTAKEETARHNRNLLQYAAFIAALVGIGSGSGGVFAIAAALSGDDDKNLPEWVATVAIVAGVIIVSGSLVLLAFMICAFVRRRAAERDVDKNLEELVRLVPDRFLPKAE